MLLYRDEHDPNTVHVYGGPRTREWHLFTAHIDSLDAISPDAASLVRDSSRMDFPLKVTVKIEVEAPCSP